MKTLLLPLAVLVLAGCASSNYHSVKHQGTNTMETTFTSHSLFSTTAVKGIIVDGNGDKRDSPGLRMTGVATDPNAASITATGDALGSLVGAAIATGIKGAK